MPHRPADSVALQSLMHEVDHACATHNNRLLYYELYDEGQTPRKLLRTVTYTYYDDGDALQTPAVAYTAFGETIGDATTLATRYQYAGRYGYESDLLALSGVNPNLPDISLQHVGARWYQPDIGRFIQPDPIGVEGGFNPYAYVQNNPIVRIDPLGEFLILIFQDIGCDIRARAWERAFLNGEEEKGREIIRAQAAGAGAGLAAVGGGLGARAAIRYCIPHLKTFLGPEGPVFGKGRGLNTGKLRLGWSKHKGKWRFSIRWKKGHWDLW